MATKQNPPKYDCLAHAMQDEPYFVLLARDAAGGHQALFEWILKRLEAVRDGKKPLSDIPQVREALDCLYDMQSWHEQHQRSGAPQSLLKLPSAGDKAWINGVLNVLQGRASVHERDDAGADQGFGGGRAR